MTTTARQNPWFATRGAPSLWALAASMFVPMAALAQGNACDQLKATLAARIEATGLRGYSLEAVPAATPVPAGAKAIGNCEGGERKILYRRWGGASAPASSPASTPVVAPEAPAKRPAPQVVRAELPVPVASAPVSKPTPLPPVKAEAPTPPPARASEVQLVRAAESAVPKAVSPSPVDAVDDKPPLAQRVSGFVVTHWHWLLALLLVPLVAVGWAWRAHHLAYDKNGLPRGPRL